MRAPFLTAEWRSLAMLNYSADPAVLAPYVPSGLELELFEGVAYLSLVGFLFLDCRLIGVPVPFHRNFEEVNLRFYVTRKAGDELRRGVVFIQEIVPKPAIAWTARTIFQERYTAMPMRHSQGPGRVTYGWSTPGRWHSFQLDFQGEPTFAREGSEEQFITEHYWGYSLLRNGGCYQYRVDHPRWRVWSATAWSADVDFAEVYGDRFAPLLRMSPSSAFVAEGSAVSVGWPRALR
jgi:uncharacterized protein YqjF (DUF2071 family)